MWKAIGYLLIAILVVDTAVITTAYIRQSNNLTGAQANVTALQSEVKTLNGELVTLRGSVALMQSKLADSDARASLLQTRLTAAEANVTSLLSALNKTNTDYAKAVQLAAANTSLTRGPIYDPALGLLVPVRPVNPALDYGAGMGAP